MVRAIYPGSFDPVTYGHLDVIKRASKIVDELIVGVLNNKSKTPLFSVENRVKMLNDAVSDLPNVKVMSFEGLLVDFAKKVDAQLIVRGLRAVTDFEYELQMSQTNSVLNNEVDTILQQVWSMRILARVQLRKLHISEQILVNLFHQMS